MTIPCLFILLCIYVWINFKEREFISSAIFASFWLCTSISRYPHIFNICNRHKKRAERRTEPFLWTLFNFLLDVCMKYAWNLLSLVRSLYHICMCSSKNISSDFPLFSCTLIFNMLMKISSAQRKKVISKSNCATSYTFT